MKPIVQRDRDGTITDIVERPDFATRQRAVKDAWTLRGRIGPAADEEGNFGQPLQINILYETAKKVERLVGRKIIDVPVEESQPASSPEAAEPAPSSSSPGDVRVEEPPAAERATADRQESEQAEESVEDLSSLIGAEW